MFVELYCKAIDDFIPTGTYQWFERLPLDEAAEKIGNQNKEDPFATEYMIVGYGLDKEGPKLERSNLDYALAEISLSAKTSKFKLKRCVDQFIYENGDIL